MCKVLGIGVDLCAISRMEGRVGDQRFLSRCLTPAEQQYVRGRGLMASASLAAIWAAKEAAGKALGVGIAFPLTDVEIVHAEGGAPGYALHGQALALSRGGRMLLSLSHEGDMAAAFCLWTEGEEEQTSVC